VRLPFVSPVRGHFGIPRQRRATGVKGTSFLSIRGSLFENREREAARGVVPAAPLLPSIRGASVTGFSQGEVRHECTKQALARLRSGRTGGPARGYERSRVARPEHLILGGSNLLRGGPRRVATT